MTNVSYASKTEHIVDALKAKQDAEGLDDTAFASKLGISYSLWLQIKNKGREMGAKPLRGIAAHYPDIWAMLGIAFAGISVELAPEKGQSREPIEG